jgi:regulator of cell morphogenesis and NO signaling
MNEHLWKEEMILFPLVRAMTAGTRGTASHCGGKQNPIRVMLMEHDAADRALVALR